MKIQNSFLSFLPILAMGFATTSCSAEPVPNIVASYESNFNGLANGQELDSGCIRFQSLSVTVQYQDIDQILTVFSDLNCTEKYKISSMHIDAFDIVAGEWNQWLVLDSGSGPDSRELHLLKPTDLSDIKSLVYVDAPTFTNQYIEFLQPMDLAKNAIECGDQKGLYEEFTLNGLGVGIANAMVYDAKTNSVKATGDQSCFAVQ